MTAKGESDVALMTQVDNTAVRLAGEPKGLPIGGGR